MFQIYLIFQIYLRNELCRTATTTNLCNGLKESRPRYIIVKVTTAIQTINPPLRVGLLIQK